MLRTADAYDNVLMALGEKNGLAFVEARKDMAAYFIYKTSRWYYFRYRQQPLYSIDQ